MPIRKGISLQAGPEQEVPLSDHDSNDWSNHQRLDFGELQDLAFSRRLVAAGERHLLANIFDDVDDGGLLISREVQLGTLQRMVLHDLQRQLLQIVRDIHESKNATPGLMSSASLALAKYCTCLGISRVKGSCPVSPHLSLVSNRYWRSTAVRGTIHLLSHPHTNCVSPPPRLSSQRLRFYQAEVRGNTQQRGNRSFPDHNRQRAGVLPIQGCSPVKGPFKRRSSPTEEKRSIPPGQT